MNKMFMRSLLGFSFILFSLSPKILADSCCDCDQTCPVDTLDQVLESDPFFGPHWGFMKIDPAAEIQKIKDALKKIESEEQRLRKHLADVVEKNKYQVNEYEAQEYEAGDEDVYGVKIALPGFKQEDVTVTISSDEKNNQTVHRIELKGTKNVATTSEEEKEVKGKKVSMKKISSQAFSSSTFINGRQKVIEYKDGKLKINLDLPNDVDVQEGKYTMKFDDKKETLSLEFPRKLTPRKKKMHLSYTDK